MSMNNEFRKKIIVFASGKHNGGGSGFQGLIEAALTDPPKLKAYIVAVISDHERGGVCEIAKKYRTNFEYWPGPHDKDGYRAFIEKYDPCLAVCCGWNKFIHGLKPEKTVNIHPGPKKRFGGKNMYGANVHKAVIEAYRRKEISQSAVSIHCADEIGYDHGSSIVEVPVLIRPDDTPESLESRVKEVERAWYCFVIDLILSGEIILRQDGVFFSDHAEAVLKSYKGRNVRRIFSAPFSYQSC